MVARLPTRPSSRLRRSGLLLRSGHPLQGTTVAKPTLPSHTKIEYVDSVDPSERYEQLIAFLSTHLPAPVEQEEDANGVLVFTGGSPGEVVARLTATSVI